jgi:hypothetical protein
MEAGCLGEGRIAYFKCPFILAVSCQRYSSERGKPENQMRIVQATESGFRTLQEGSDTHRTRVVMERTLPHVGVAPRMSGEKTIHSCTQMTIRINSEVNGKTRSGHARSPDLWVSNKRSPNRLNSTPRTRGETTSAAHTNGTQSLQLPPKPPLLPKLVRNRARGRDAIGFALESTRKR